VSNAPTDSGSLSTAGSDLRRRRLVGALCAVALLLGGTGVYYWYSRAHDRPRPPTIDLEKADPAVARAIREATDAVRQAPASARAWGELGLVLSAHDFQAEADQCFVRAEELDPNDARWPYHQGTRLSVSDPDAALRKLQRAAQLGDQRSQPAQLRVCELLLELDRFEEATAGFQQLLDSDASNPRAHLGLARLALIQGDLQASLKHLKSCVDSPFTRKAAQVLRAQVLERQGEKREAEQQLQQAGSFPADAPWPDGFTDEIARQKTGESLRGHLADQLIERGRTGEAIALLQKTARDYPRSARTWLCLGWAHNEEKSFVAAEKALRNALELSPELADAHHYLGIALAGQARFADAAAEFRKATGLKADHTEAYFNLAFCLERLDDLQGGIAALRQAVRCRPQSAAVHKALGEALTRAGRHAEAIAPFEAALLLNPDDAAVRKQLDAARVRARGAADK
jgi:tetratricopeptide (TPR) repeat protein